MKGEILDYDIDADDGLIAGEDGARYSFRGAEVKAEQPPRPGDRVDFQPEGGMAKGIYVMPPAIPSDAKNKVVAGLLAIFLGGLGIHKFYLGYSTAGIIMLAVSVLGMIIVVPTLIVGVIAFIEGIIYLVKTDAEFHRRYVVNRHPWF